MIPLISMCFRLFILAWFILFFSQSVYSQSNSSLSGKHITQSIRTYEYLHENETSIVLISTITEKIIPINDQIIFSYPQYIFSRELQLTDIVLVDRITLKPVFYGTHAQNMQTNSVDYSDVGNVVVRIKRTVPGFEADTAYSVPFKEFRYDGHWILPILYSLKMDSDLHLKIPTFIYSLGKTEIEITLLGEEQLSLNDETFNAWKLNIKNPGFQEATVWLDKKNQRLLLLKSIPDSQGNITWQRYTGG